MALYRRLILALCTALALGASSVVLLAAGPLHAWHQWLLLTLLAGTVMMVLARWVLRPLRELAAEMSGRRVDVHDLEAQIDRIHHQELDALSDVRHEAELALEARLAPWVRDNQALFLLFQVVSQDQPGSDPVPLIDAQLPIWLDYGPRAAAVSWHGAHALSFAARGGLSVDDIPVALKDFSGSETHIEMDSDTVWMVVPVPGETLPGTPRNLILAWSDGVRPSEGVCAAWNAMARYLAVRCWSGADLPLQEKVA